MGIGRQGLLTAVLLLAVWTARADECRPPGVALALGSGGAAGLAHIAVLGVFDELGIRPEAIAGTSIGAIMGALYAAGLSADEIEQDFRDFGGSALDPLSGLIGDNGPPGLSDLVEIDLANGSFIDSDRFIDFIASRMEARSFDQLRLPLYLVATDFWTGQSHVFEEGDLLRAVQASMAVPGLFAPVKLDDKLLIDGGTSNPLPVDLLEGHDLVVAIDVTGARQRETEGRPDVTDLLFSSFEIMQQSILRGSLQRHSVDIYIKPELTGIRMLHFDRVDAILEQARPAAGELRKQLQALIDCD